MVEKGCYRVKRNLTRKFVFLKFFFNVSEESKQSKTKRQMFTSQ